MLDYTKKYRDEEEEKLREEQTKEEQYEHLEKQKEELILLKEELDQLYMMIKDMMSESVDSEKLNIIEKKIEKTLLKLHSLKVTIKKTESSNVSTIKKPRSLQSRPEEVAQKILQIEREIKQYIQDAAHDKNPVARVMGRVMRFLLKREEKSVGS